MRRSSLRIVAPLTLLILAAGGRAGALRAGTVAANQAAPPAASRIDAGELMADLRMLADPALEGRLAGSDGGRRARRIIVERFRELKLQPILDGSYEQPFPLRGAAGSGGRAGTNVVGLARGASSRVVMVTAHYDHLGVRSGRVYPGADDNASGVAAMLAIARWFARHPPPVSVLFVAFDMEEEGLQGSRHFVAHAPIDLSSVTAVVNMDMIGRGDDNTLYVAGTHYYPHLKAPVAAAAAGAGIDVRFGHDRPGAPGGDWTQSSDHASFHAAGVPFLYFGVNEHPDYHRPTDTADKVPAAFYRQAVAVVLDTVLRLLEMPGRREGAAVQEDQGARSIEQAIVGHVDAGQAAALALLERVVNINSGSMNFEGVRAVGRVFAGELEAIGFTARWVDGAPFKRAGHLVAERRGSGPRVLLIGHLDTVFEPDSPFQRFERVDERTARGPGIIDMKGGDVVMVRALAALHAARALDGLDVTVVMTGDEESSGEPLAAARQALVDAARGREVALGFENGPGNPRTAVVARRGAVGWQLRVEGKSAHASQIFSPDVGGGAIYEAARILDGFRQELAGEPHLTFNTGVIVGGTAAALEAEQGRGTAAGKENVVAARALAMGDLRTLSLDQLEGARTRMLGIVRRSLPHTRAELSFDEGYPPLPPSDGNRRLLAMYDQASRDVGAGPVGAVDPDRAGAADVSFVAGHVPMILDGIGLMGHSDHSPQETADLATLPSQTKRAALLLYRISRGAHTR